MKKLWAEFKKFISRGNVLDMAVGVIIGGAFTAIVTALTNGILKPFINWLIALAMGGAGDLSKVYTVLKPVYTVVDGVQTLDLASSIYIDWGALLSAIINFFLVAIIVFTIVKIFNSARDLAGKAASMDARIELKQKAGKKLSKKEVAYLEQKKAAEEAAEEAKRKAEEEAAQPTKTEALLMEILAELQKKQ